MVGFLSSILSWIKRHEQRIGTILGVLGLIGLPSVHFLLADVATTTREFVYAGCLVATCLGVLMFSLGYVAIVSRKARYVDTLPRLQKSLRQLQHTLAKPDPTPNDLRSAAGHAMNEFAAVFSLLTGAACRSCVKVVEPINPAGLMEVVTLCRDSGDNKLGAKHPITHNTDFNDLFQNPDKLWFVGNNLPRLAQKGEYLNTNKEYAKKYRATAVWPIREQPEPPDGEPTTLLGYLCVDTMQENAFREEFDYPLGAMVAEALAALLVKLSECESGSPSTPDLRLEATPDGQLLSGKIPLPAPDPDESKEKGKKTVSKRTKGQGVDREQNA